MAYWRERRAISLIRADILPTWVPNKWPCILSAAISPDISSALFLVAQMVKRKESRAQSQPSRSSIVQFIWIRYSPCIKVQQSNAADVWFLVYAIILTIKVENFATSISCRFQTSQQCPPYFGSLTLRGKRGPSSGKWQATRGMGEGCFLS